MSINWDEYFQSKTLDLRNDKYRFTDQKCTPDVMAAVASTVVSSPATKAQFTEVELRSSEYFIHSVQFLFNKPNPKQKETRNEYDKFIGQQLKSLSYAGILEENKRGKSNVYRVIDREALQDIALNHLNSYQMLVAFYRKVLSDSGQLYRFEAYRQSSHTQEDLISLRDGFYSFFRANSKLGAKGGSGETEYRRIFPKLLNPLAVHWRIPGSRRGRVTRYPFTFHDLLYNAPNPQDVDKQKNVPRAVHAENSVSTMENVLQDQLKKARTAVQKYHHEQSEVRDNLANTRAGQVHHIFPKSTFPDFVATKENLICLTASQHNERAHPKNNTNSVDSQYQLTCLLAKLDSIEESERRQDHFYNLERFILMLNQTMEVNLAAELTIEEVRRVLPKLYARTA